MKYLFLFWAALLWLRPVSAFPFEMNDTLQVFHPEGLKLRESPGFMAPASITIHYGEKVIVLKSYSGDADKAVTIDKIPGHWILVRFQENSGFVFDGYLSRLPIPALTGNVHACDNGFTGVLKEYALTAFAKSGKMDTIETNRSNGKTAKIDYIQPLQDSGRFIIHNFLFKSAKYDNYTGLAGELILGNIRITDAFTLMGSLLNYCTYGKFFIDRARFEENEKGDIIGIEFYNNYSDLFAKIVRNRDKTISIWCYTVDRL